MNADGPTDGGAITGPASVASFATPEIRGLFEEWAKAVEEEIVAFLKRRDRASPRHSGETQDL